MAADDSPPDAFLVSADGDMIAVHSSVLRRWSSVLNDLLAAVGPSGAAAGPAGPGGRPRRLGLASVGAAAAGAAADAPPRFAHVADVHSVHPSGRPTHDLPFHAEDVRFARPAAHTAEPASAADGDADPAAPTGHAAPGPAAAAEPEPSPASEPAAAIAPTLVEIPLSRWDGPTVRTALEAVYPPGTYGAAPLDLTNLEKVVELARALGLEGVQRRAEDYVVSLADGAGGLDLSPSSPFSVLKWLRFADKNGMPRLLQKCIATITEGWGALPRQELTRALGGLANDNAITTLLAKIDAPAGSVPDVVSAFVRAARADPRQVSALLHNQHGALPYTIALHLPPLPGLQAPALLQGVAAPPGEHGAAAAGGGPGAGAAPPARQPRFARLRRWFRAQRRVYQKTAQDCFHVMFLAVMFKTTLSIVLGPRPTIYYVQSGGPGPEEDSE